ncbi:MAG: transcription-repair coupling factor, partial [Clostridia bacterium]|nr:transcription-repair coupling factor [Clostridia bacterium]
GQFAVRGGIIDIWTSAKETPMRVEFFGDEVDRISVFDIESQRSVAEGGTLKILPALEVVITKESSAKISHEIEKLIANAKDDLSREKLAFEKSYLDAGITLPSRDKYFSLIYSQKENLFTYAAAAAENAGKRCVAYSLGTNEVRESAEKKEAVLRSSVESLVERGLATSRTADTSMPLSALDKALSEFVRIDVNSFAGGLGNSKLGGLFGFRCRRTVAYGGSPSLLFEDLRAFRKGLYRVLVLSETKQGADSLIASLAGEDIFAEAVYDIENFDVGAAEGGRIFVGVGSGEGFDLISPKIAVLSMQVPEGHATMKARRDKRLLKKIGGAGERLMSHADLSVGDYVVHANYGIGLFEGIQSVTVDGVTRDYITIRYAGTDKLFVPCDRIELIGKYIGRKDDTGAVKLSKMGGGDWNRAKTRAKSAAKDIAKDLIRLYAERQRKPGFAFPEDSDLEDEFAASFEYVETDSQLVAIEEIKRDMMRPVPMNRLLCGDVGFGKTEVALRAAFKAIMGGKQVAILVPTTILALQHYQTALSRMRGYPVTVEMISRFRKPKEQEAILRKTKRGEIDILIGTHKLISKKVEFRDLGLLIIDEEQRFGVAQKEKLKEMSSNVDVLTLTATPIPRTLNMAMNGISDMSILDEAPGERHPVQTYVLEYDEGIIFDAIRKELMRSGQVLYLYNKISDIVFVADKIMKAIPEARVAVAHGAMEKDELEDIWQTLVRGEIDVLVCTTIIETGIDLPSANTLIIENADRMGLSQLHQIRGRVGRSERVAYAYFTFRPGKALSEIAEKRLNAIREFASFGAGFKIALRDLEIRGAGNLLGAEQHGYIESVGYDLYVRLLSEAVLEESGRVEEKKTESTVDIKVSANIPEKYISVSSQRMEMYKKISLIRDEEDMQDILDEFIDRFGEPPKEVIALLKISLIRALCSENAIERVEVKDVNVLFHSQKPSLDVWSEVFGEYSGLSFRSTAAGPVVVYRLARGQNETDAALDIL